MPLPAHRYSLAENETFKVKVFRDHSEWDRREKWWMLPTTLLNELFVASYECSCQEHLDWLEKEHPGCIFVY